MAVKLRFRSLRLVVPVILLVLALGAVAPSYAKEDAWLGVMLQPLTDELKEAMDIKQDLRGVLISDVVDHSPADEYGLEDGDVIIEIDGKEIDTVKGAVKAIRSYSPGEEVKIVILREGDEQKDFVVKLGEREEKEYEAYDYEFIPEMGHKFRELWHKDQAFLGVRVEEISSDLGEYFDVNEGEGILVMEVIEDSPAEEAGLKAGDVILKIDDKEMTSTGKLVRYIGKSEPGEKVTVTYKRKRKTRTVEVELGEADQHGKLSCCRIFEDWCCPGGHARSFIQKFKGPGEYKVKKIRIPGRADVDIPELEDIKILEIERGDLEEAVEKLKEEIEKLKAEMKKLREE